MGYSVLVSVLVGRVNMELKNHNVKEGFLR